jgi:hypothetical protein
MPRVTAIGYLGIAVALLGAFLLSFGSAVQQRGIAGVGSRSDGKGGLAIKQMLSLATNRTWLMGTAMISARAAHHSLGGQAIRAISLCVIAVVIFVTVAALTTHVAAIRNNNVIVVLIVVGSVVVGIGAAFLAARKRLTRIFYVLASGALFGFVATLAKVIIGRVETVVAGHHSPFAVGGLTYVCLLGIIVAGSLGQYLQQSAFTSGSPEVVVAGLTVVDPIVGATVGLAALGEAASAPAWSFVVFAAAGALAVLGVVRLSRSRPANTSVRPTAPASHQQ